MSLERLNALVEKISMMKEENRALRAEISVLKQMACKTQKANKSEKKQTKKEMTPSLF